MSKELREAIEYVRSFGEAEKALRDLPEFLLRARMCEIVCIAAESTMSENSRIRLLEVEVRSLRAERGRDGCKGRR